jgi:hypothetical protein
MRRELPDIGTPAVWLFGGGIAMRAFGQLAAPGDAIPRPALDALVPLLYCVGFGYALLGLHAARYTVWLHLGAAGMLAAALLDALVGNTPAGFALFAAGAAALTLRMLQGARRSGGGAGRLALLVAATGPGLFVLHALAFAAGTDLLQARFLRLGATAAMALPLLATIYHLHVLGVETSAARLARTLSTIGMAAVPLVLVLSAFADQRLKYALGPATDCIVVALVIACVQAWRRGERTALAGFATLLASMLLGKLMGFYAFDGPLSPPSAMAAYADAWRVSLRNFHIDLMVLGYGFLLWPLLVRPRTIAVAALALVLGLCAPALEAWSRPAVGATVLWLVVFWRGRASA